MGKVDILGGKGGEKDPRYQGRRRSLILPPSLGRSDGQISPPPRISARGRRARRGRLPPSLPRGRRSGRARPRPEEEEEEEAAAASSSRAPMQTVPAPPPPPRSTRMLSAPSSHERPSFLQLSLRSSPFHLGPFFSPLAFPIQSRLEQRGGNCRNRLTASIRNCTKSSLEFAVRSAEKRICMSLRSTACREERP